MIPGNSAFSQDINFDGSVTPLTPGSNDWANIHLNQAGGRRNVGGIFLDTRAGNRRTLGPLSLDVGRSDIGRSDIGRSDIGRSDIGRSDIGAGDLGHGDIGRSDIGRSDIGRSDIGRGLFGGGDLDVGGPVEVIGELDLETATAPSGNAPSPPNGLKACLTAGSECANESGDTPVKVEWQAPHLGKVVGYFVYRFEVDPASFPPANLPATPIGTVGLPEGSNTPLTTFLDFSAPSGANLAYFVRAEFDDSPVSGISNFATITTPRRLLAFVDQPASTRAGQPMSPIRVAVQDTFGQTIDSSGATVSLTIASGPSGAVLSGTTLQTTVHGIATFSNLSITMAGTGYALAAVSAPFTPATSQTFDIIYDPPMILTGALPEGTRGAPYSQTVAAQGGVPPYAWDIKPIPNNPQFALPDGLTLVGQPDGTGKILRYADDGSGEELQSSSDRLTGADGDARSVHSHRGFHRRTASGDGLEHGYHGRVNGTDARGRGGQAITLSNVQHTGAPAARSAVHGRFPPSV